MIDCVSMTYLPTKHASWRVPRVRFAETTPVVLRCLDGCSVKGKLQVISLTGGLLGLSRPLDQGSQVKLMFLTGEGSVLGVAEMLRPVTWGLQPFKFVKLYEDDRLRLQAVIQSSLEQQRHDRELMERYRAW
jgi:hypothetical protein